MTAGVNSPFGVAVDGAGNVFESGAPTANIAEYPKGHQTGNKILGVTGLLSPEGLEFDVKGNLIVFDLFAGILIYAPPYKGAPTHTITPKGKPVYGKLDKANRNLYVSNNSNGSADAYAYPSGNFEYSITNGLSASKGVEGIAEGFSSFETTRRA